MKVLRFVALVRQRQLIIIKIPNTQRRNTSPMYGLCALAVIPRLGHGSYMFQLNGIDLNIEMLYSYIYKLYVADKSDHIKHTKFTFMQKVN